MYDRKEKMILEKWLYGNIDDLYVVVRRRKWWEWMIK